jgi:Tfp pilus assembly protein PilN
VVAALWVLVIASNAITLSQQRRAIDRELAQLAEPIAALSAVQREITTGQAMINTVGDDGARRGSTVQLLAAITAALPDSAFLTSLSIASDGRGFLGGYGKRASEVLARLESSGATINPRLDGQLGREVIAASEWERFSIAFDAKGGE